MSILLVGCGYWGRNWAKSLYSLSELGAICEPTPSLQAQLKSQYPDVPLYGDLNEALESSGIEACVVATPVITHLDVAGQCLRAGRHVLVEKPLALQAAEAEELVQLAEDEGLVLAVGHLLMYHPALLVLREMIQAGELGEVLSIQCTRVNLGKVRNEENAWWSLAPHDLSIITLLLEEQLLPVSASCLNLLRRSKIPDAVMASFVTSSGCEATVEVSWLSPVKKHETLVIGSRKIAIFDDTLPPERKLSLWDYQLDRQGDTVLGIRRGESKIVPYEMGTDLLTREAQAYISAIREGTPIPNDGRNGLLVVRMLEQIESMFAMQTEKHLLSRS